MQIDDFSAGMHTQIGVEVGKRLIHQEEGRTPYHRPCQCHALTLTAGHLAGLAIEQMLDLQGLRHVLNLSLDGAAGFFLTGQQIAKDRQPLNTCQFAHRQRNGDVLCSG